MEEKFVERKNIRLNKYDYNKKGAYFITICTKKREEILSQIVGTGVLDCPQKCVQIELTRYGEIAENYIKQLNDFYGYMSVERYIIMPDHIHILLIIKENGQSRTPVPTRLERSNSEISKFVSTFKRFCNKEYGDNIWQERFYDHIIRNKEDYDEHIKYIHDNPIKWYYEHK